MEEAGRVARVDAQQVGGEGREILSVIILQDGVIVSGGGSYDIFGGTNKTEIFNNIALCSVRVSSMMNT